MNYQNNYTNMSSQWHEDQMVLADNSKENLFPHYEGSEFRKIIIHLHRENNSTDQLKHSSTHQEYAAQGIHDLQ